MEHDRSFINIDNVPILRWLAPFVKLLSIFVMVASFGMACVLLPHYWKRYRTAETRYEKAYFGVRFAGLWCFVYAISLLAISIVDGAYEWGLINHWPTLSFMIFDWGMSHSNSIHIDIALALVLAIPLIITANQFGSEDERSGEYRIPERVAANDHIEDVMRRYHTVKVSNPKLRLDEFVTYPRSIQNSLIAEYNSQLADIEDRVRTVHQIWHKQCPID
jgi:hypothetical protein